MVFTIRRKNHLNPFIFMTGPSYNSKWGSTFTKTWPSIQCFPPHMKTNEIWFWILLQNNESDTRSWLSIQWVPQLTFGRTVLLCGRIQSSPNTLILWDMDSISLDHPSDLYPWPSEMWNSTNHFFHPFSFRSNLRTKVFGEEKPLFPDATRLPFAHSSDLSGR